MNDYKSPEWQKKRLEIFKRDDWQCYWCGVDNKPLSVHHKLYLHKRKIWDYPNEFLVTLCDGCHLGAHKSLDEFHKTLCELKFEQFVFLCNNNFNDFIIERFDEYNDLLKSKKDEEGSHE